MGHRDRRDSARTQATPVCPERQGVADISVQVSEPGEAVLVICGTLDLSGARQVVRLVEVVIDCGCRRLLLDLTTGIAVKLEATGVWRLLAQLMSYRDGAIAVLAPADQEYLELLRGTLSDALPIFTSKHRALRYLRYAFPRSARRSRCLLAH